MFEIEKKENNIVEITLHDKLSRKDYLEDLIPALNGFTASGGAVKLLIIVPHDFRGWSLGAMLEDAKFGISHLRGFGGIAIVGTAFWIPHAVRVGRFILGLKVRRFHDVWPATRWLRDI